MKMIPLFRRRTRLLLFIVLAIVFVTYFRGRGQESWLRDGSPEILNATLGFQEVFVVNLPSRSDRRDGMTLLAALTGLRLTFVDGILGETVLEKAVPPGEKNNNVKSPGKIGNWRAHMNVLQRIVRENISTALIMEDDLDWDIRLPSQLQQFAQASQTFLQPLLSDPSSTLSNIHRLDPRHHDAKHHFINLYNAPATVPAKTSPYGDNWDILWLGHTGCELPTEWHTIERNLPYPPRTLLTLTIPDDHTVPAPHHIRRHPFADHTDRFAQILSPHTRVVHEARSIGGAQALAVSQRGARRLLHQFGLVELTDMWDISLRDFCEGVFAEDGRERPVCVTTQPPLMAQYWSHGGSDLENVGGGFFKKVGSVFIRYSVRVNMKTLLERRGAARSPIEGLVDQWPDEGDGPW